MPRARWLRRNTAGTLSTLAVDPAGYPFGSVVSFTVDADGDPLFVISRLAVHTRNLLADPRASLLVAEAVDAGIDPLARSRVTLLGDVAPVPAAEQETAVEAVASTGARPSPATRRTGTSPAIACASGPFDGSAGSARWTGSTATAIAPPRSTPCSPRRHRIIAHMNDDHADAGLLLCEPGARRARRIGDRCATSTASGASTSARLDDGVAIVRLAFSAPATGLDDVRQRMVELVHRARAQMSRRVVAVSVTAILATIGGCGGDSPAADPPPAQRIIPVNGDLAEVVYALGLGDQVVATDISATYPPAAAATPKIGYQRTLVAETILSYEPTVVLADDLAGPPEVLDQLDCRRCPRGRDRATIARSRASPRRSATSPPRSASRRRGTSWSSSSSRSSMRPRRAASDAAVDVRPAEGARPLPARRERPARVRQGQRHRRRDRRRRRHRPRHRDGRRRQRRAVDRVDHRGRSRRPARHDDRPGVGRRRRRAARDARHRPDTGGERTAASSPSRTSTCTGSGRASASSSTSSSTPSTPTNERTPHATPCHPDRRRHARRRRMRWRRRLGRSHQRSE